MMGVLDDIPPATWRGQTIAAPGKIADFYRNGGVAGLLGMAPAWQQIVDSQAKADAVRESGGSLLDQMKADEHNPMLTALGPSNMGAVAGVFAGQGAKTADVVKLGLAQKMDSAGADRAEIWNATGWFKGPDKKWRFEIDDSNSTLNFDKLPDAPHVLRIADEKLGLMPQYQHLGPGLRIGNPKVLADDQRRALSWAKENPQEPKAMPLGEVMNHDELGAAYPEIMDMNIRRHLGQAQGMYSRADNTISTGGGVINGSTPRSTSLHELQHAIQEREGFAKGGSRSEFNGANLSERELLDAKIIAEKVKGGMMPTEARDWFERALGRKPSHASLEHGSSGVRHIDPTDAYRFLAGEAEARNVQKRMDMTPRQRRDSPPWTTLDVPEDRLIVRGLLEDK
jgi:hypothetical protein